MCVPLGTEVPFFNRDPNNLVDILDRHGFNKISGWTLSVHPDGKADTENYTKYSTRPSRMAARYQRVPVSEKILRLNNVQIPNLIETPTQTIQKGLLREYFKAWETQSSDKISKIFTRNATYDEKPGIERPLKGIEEIVSYWNKNPVAQKNIQILYKIVGFSGTSSIWSEFEGSFDIRGKHVEISGIIEFDIDLNEKKIQKLAEYFTTQKTDTPNKV